MKTELKLNFTDFWIGFIKTDNYFYNLLFRHYNLSISDEPDILFYSCYGNEYLKFDCIRIFYTAENIRPDFTGCDFAISFDHNLRSNHYRLPLYGLYIEHQYNGSRGKTMEELTAIRGRKEVEDEWAKKTKFCCMVVSNPYSKKRLNFFQKLSSVQHVDSGGKTMNNIGGPVADKLTFIKDYRFVIAFENQSYPGYTTEKLLEPLFTDAIPIYWGNPDVSKDFNKNRFINYSDFKSEQALIEKIIQIDNDPELAIKMLTEPIFPHNRIPTYIDDENVHKFLKKIIDAKDTLKPVAQTFKKSFHFINRKKNVVKNNFISLLGMQKR